MGAAGSEALRDRRGACVRTAARGGVTPAPSRERGRLRLGTSGWHYAHWVGPFYPPGLPPERMLAHYARSFESVEINSTFYGLPAGDTLRRWARETPAGFLFAVKASRYLTHMKKLKEPGEALERFFAAIAPLGRKLGPVLFQLPPRWRADPGRLAGFLDLLPRGRRYGFEFRDESWFGEEVLDLLRAHRAAFCVYDLAGRSSPLLATAPFVYVRLHGPAGAYEGRYGPAGLAPWAEALGAWLRRGMDVYCYFDNDQRGYAAADAADLAAMLRGAGQGR